MFKGEIKNIAPEYEDCKKMAKQHQVPLKEVYEEAKWSVQHIADSEEKSN
jgi:hypothetical protein